MSIRSEVVRIFNELLAGAKKITELTVATTPLSGTEKVEIVQGGESRQATTQDIADLGGGGAVSSVNGQTGAVVVDLQSAMTQGSSASVAAPVSIVTSTADDITLDAGSRLVLKTNGGTEQLVIGADGGWYLSGSDPGTSGQVITSNGAAPPTWGNAAAAAAWGGITGTLSSQTDLQNALNAKLALAGGTMSGNIAMGNNKVTGLAAATTNGDALRYEQFTGFEDDLDFALILGFRNLYNF